MLLQTKGVLARPWVILELYTARACAGVCVCCVRACARVCVRSMLMRVRVHDHVCLGVEVLRVRAGVQENKDGTPHLQ